MVRYRTFQLSEEPRRVEDVANPRNREGQNRQKTDPDEDELDSAHPLSASNAIRKLKNLVTHEHSKRGNLLQRLERKPTDHWNLDRESGTDDEEQRVRFPHSGIETAQEDEE